MAFAIRTATDYKDCLDQIRQFTQKEFKAGAVSAGTNTGDGTVYGASASENSVAETWTITCSTSGGNDTAQFSVIGGTSGTKAIATAGVPYSIDEVSFVIVSGDTDFAVSDSFTFVVAASTAEWVQDSWDTDYDGNGGYELIQHGIGGGSDEIYAGIKSRSNDSTYWNIEQSGFTGYVDFTDFEGQPGYMPRWTCGNNATFQFYVSFTSRRINYCLVPVEGSHEYGGVGWLNSYASPSQWSYPNFCGGSANSSSATIGSTTDRGNFVTGTNLRILNGNDIISGLAISPYSFGGFNTFRSSVDGFMRLYPATPVQESEDLVTGELDGMFWVSPYVPQGGLLTALALIVGTVEDYGGSTRQVCGVSFRNVTLTSAGQISVFDLTGDE